MSVEILPEFLLLSEGLVVAPPVVFESICICRGELSLISVTAFSNENASSIVSRIPGVTQIISIYVAH